MTTKRDIITSALNEVGIASYDFDVRPEQIIAALGQLDRMVSAWSLQGINIPYIQGSTDPDDLILSPDWAHEALTLNLAVRLGPSYGRGSSPDTKQAALAAMYGIRTRSAINNMPVVQMDNRSIPAGAGNRTMSPSRVFLVPAVNELEISEGLALNMGPV